MVEECRTAMLHDDTTLARLKVSAQSIEESNLRRMDRSLKRSGASDQAQTSFKKKVQSQGESRSAKFKLTKEVVPRIESLLVQIVARNIIVSFYWVPRVALVVVKMGTK